MIPFSPDIPQLGVLNSGVNFKAIDYTHRCKAYRPIPTSWSATITSSSVSIPSFQVFDKTATARRPDALQQLLGSNCGTGSNVVMFDPYSVYDEEANRYVSGHYRV